MTDSNLYTLIEFLKADDYDENEIQWIVKGAVDSLDYELYMSHEYNCLQMEQLYLGLKDSIDITEFSDPLYSANHMELIRWIKTNNYYSPIEITPWFEITDFTSLKRYIKSYNDDSDYKQTTEDIQIIEELSTTKKEHNITDYIDVYDEEKNELSFMDTSFSDDYIPYDDNNPGFSSYVYETLSDDVLETDDDIRYYLDFDSIPTTVERIEKMANDFSSLSKQDERKLIRRIIYDDDEEASNRFFTSHLNHAIDLANRYPSQLIETEDLYQQSFVTLYSAIDRYNTNIKYPLTTYANMAISRSIFSYLSKNDRVISIPDRQYRKLYSLNKHKYSFETKYGHQPSIKELSEYCDKTYEETEQLLQLNHIDEIELTNYENYSVDQTGYDTEIQFLKYGLKDEFKKTIFELLLELTEREEKMLVFLYGLNDYRERTTTQVANMFNVPNHTILKYEKRAIKKLREHHRKKRLSVYLIMIE